MAAPKRVSSTELIALLTETGISGAKLVEIVPDENGRESNCLLIPWTRYAELTAPPAKFWAAALDDFEPGPGMWRQIRVYRSESGTMTDARPVQLQWWGSGDVSSSSAEVPPAQRPRAERQASLSRGGYEGLPLRVFDWSVGEVKEAQREMRRVHEARISALEADNAFLMQQLARTNQLLFMYNTYTKAVEGGNAEAASITLEDLRTKTHEWYQEYGAMVTKGFDVFMDGMEEFNPKLARFMRMAKGKLANGAPNGAAAPEVIDVNGQ